MLQLCPFSLGKGISFFSMVGQRAAEKARR